MDQRRILFLVDLANGASCIWCFIAVRTVPGHLVILCPAA